MSRLDHRTRHDRARSRRRHSQRYRARLHKSRSGELGKPGQSRQFRGRQRKSPAETRRQRVHRPRWRRNFVPAFELEETFLAARRRILSARSMLSTDTTRIAVIALGAGFMLATALLEMIPESLKLRADSAAGFSAGTDTVFLLVLGGYFLVHFFEHTLAPHFHFGEETHQHEISHSHASSAALLGLGIHTFFDGVAIASGLLVSTWLGGIIFIAIFLHKLPEGFTVASLMLASGRSRKAAFLSSAILGATTLLGMIFMFLVRGTLTYALPIAAGVTLYVAASDLIPESNKEHGVGMALLVFVGVAVMLALKLIFHL